LVFLSVWILVFLDTDLDFSTVLVFLGSGSWFFFGLDSGLSGYGSGFFYGLGFLRIWFFWFFFGLDSGLSGYGSGFFYGLWFS
jgi:hypothetical protein